MSVIPEADTGDEPCSLRDAFDDVLAELRKRRKTFIMREPITDSGGTTSTGEGFPATVLEQNSDTVVDVGVATSEDLSESFSAQPPASTQEVLYLRPPHCPKVRWATLGDTITAREKRPCPETDNVHVPGGRWISLRLDGSGFSKFTNLLRHKGVFPKGYSPDFAEIMIACARDLLEKVNAYCAYTQSDEMTLLLPARRVDEKTGEPYQHEVNGRVQKLASQSAAFVASRFNWRLLHLFAKKGLLGALDAHGGGELIPASCLASFDCRVASYESFDDACALLLWRAYDCGVNGISDKVHHLKSDDVVLTTPELHKERAEVSGKDAGSKLQWLQRMGLLPLPAHQAHGTFQVVVRRKQECVNQKTGGAQLKLRRQVEVVAGNLIVNYLEGSLFPPDEALPTGDPRSP